MTSKDPRFAASIRRWFNRIWTPRPAAPKAVHVPADPLHPVQLSAQVVIAPARLGRHRRRRHFQLLAKCATQGPQEPAPMALRACVSPAQPPGARRA